MITTNDQKNWSDYITTGITVGALALVLLLAIGGFALSYFSLQDLAKSNGLDGWHSYVWPLLVDAALVVFSLSVVRAYMRQENSVWPWVLVGIFTLATIFFNFIHADDMSVSWSVLGVPVTLRHIVHIVPPVALVLAFETLMSMLRKEIARAGLMRSEENLHQAIDTAQGELDTLQGQVADKQKEVEDRRKKLLDIDNQIKQARQALAEAGKPQFVFLFDNDKIKPDNRQQMLAQMGQQGLTKSDIMLYAPGVFKVSDKTIQRDLSNLNGAVKQ